MAVLGLPLAFAATALGIGLFLERLLRVRLPNGLLIPLGACGSIVVSLAVYWTGSGDVPAVAITVALTIAGGVLARDGLRSRLNPGWPGLAGLAAYLLFVAPELFSGHWTWSGYNYLNDTATQLLLSSYLKVHGMHAVGLWPPRSTTTEFLRVYLATSYPLGSQAQLATLSGLLGTGPAVLYQGYLAALAGMTAMSLATLSAGLLSGRMAALAGFVAAGAALTYQWALQGSIKELGAVATAATAVAVASHVVRTGIDVRNGLLAAVPLAALLDVYYSAAVPFVGAIAVVALAAAFLLRRRRPDRRMIAALVLALAATVALAAPAVVSIRNSYNVAAGQFLAGSAPAGSANTGMQSLPFTEVSGVWLAGDYHAITAQPARLLTTLATALIFTLAVLGAALAVRERELGPALLLVAMGIVLAAILPVVTAYAGAKALAIASPALVLAALVGGLALHRVARRRMTIGWRVLRVLGPAATACVVISVLASDAVAYNYDYVAPTGRMLAIEQVGRRFAGQGLILWNEFEEFAKFFARPATINDPTEALTARQVQLLTPPWSYGSAYDLDEQRLWYVESFPVIVIRRSPSASRPPANYRLAYVNSYYEAWVREPRPVVLRHLSAQGVYSATARVGCARVDRLVAGASHDSELVAAVYPFVASFSPVAGLHPADWPIAGGRPKGLTLVGSGVVWDKLALPHAGRYELWVQGSFPRPMSVVLDGKPVGTADGVNTPNQWFPVGQAEVTRGVHYVLVGRGANGLAPGDGGAAYIGPVAISAQQPERLETVPTTRWRSLCGKTLDWVELVEH